MNRTEYSRLVEKFNAVWPKCIANDTKDELFFNLIKNLAYEDGLKVFSVVVSDSNFAPSLNKIGEAIQKVLGAGYGVKEKQEFIDRVQAGKIWCKYCASTGIVDIINRKWIRGQGAQKGAMLCGHCNAIKALKMERDGLQNYFDLNYPPHFEVQFHGDKSPYLLKPEEKQRNVELLAGLRRELAKPNNLAGIDVYIATYRKERDARKHIDKYVTLTDLF